MREIWKTIPGFHSLYQISNKGRLKSFKGRQYGGRILSNVNATGWYFSVVLQYKGERRSTRMHRLVAEAFIPNPENKPQVNHKDLNKQNNDVGNLEWATRQENNQHASDNNPAFTAGMKHYNQVIRPKMILQFTLDGEFVGQHINSMEAQKASGVCHRNILQVASQDEYKPGMTRKQAGGFIWAYEEDCL